MSDLILPDKYKKKEPVKFDCPECKGTGSVSVPGVNDEKMVTTQKECRKCRGKGYLVWVFDMKPKKSNIITP